MAGDLLRTAFPRRWRHVRGVADLAASSRLCDVSLQATLVAGAWLHDIGYAPALVDTGFHPIDGARHLRRAGVDEAVVGLVAHHSCAAVEAGLRGLAGVLNDEFPLDDRLPHDALCFCDMTTSPDGERVEVSERLTEIKSRYGPGSVVYEFVELAGNDLVGTVHRVQGSLTDQPR